MNFIYPRSPEIIFGRGSIRNLPDKVKALGIDQVFVVSDKGIRKAGITDKLIALLQEANIKVNLFEEIEKEPTAMNIEEAKKELKASGAKMVIGLGGGSALDVSKAVALLATNEGDILSYVGVEKFKKEGLPLIAIPTTAGTGSEVTRFIVFIGPEVKTKLVIVSQLAIPKCAILDPELTITLPPKVTAATGMDALTHAIESYVNVSSNYLSESLSMKAIQLIAKSLRKAVARGSNIEAREEMLAASLLAGLAFNSTRLGIVHAMSQPAGGHFDIPHGISNAILLPYVMEYNLIGNIERYIDIAVAFGEKIDGLSPMEAAMRSVKAVRDLMRDIGITEKLGDFGVREEDLEMLASEAMESGNILVNPRFPSKKDIIEIYKKAL